MDLYSGALEAVRHLVASCGPRIAHCLCEGVNHADDARRGAYLRVMHEAGLAEELIVVPDATRAAARRGFLRYLEVSGCPDGVFCWDDNTALGVYRACVDAGLSVPEQLALVGCDGIEDTEYLERPLSTIVQPIQEVCECAWAILSQRMLDPALPRQQVILQPHLAIRKTSQK